MKIRVLQNMSNVMVIVREYKPESEGHASQHTLDLLLFRPSETPSVQGEALNLRSTFSRSLPFTDEDMHQLEGWLTAYVARGMFPQVKAIVEKP